MAQKNDTAVLILALLITAGILGGGYWWFSRQSGFNLGNVGAGSQNPNPGTEHLPSPPSPGAVTAFAPPTNVPQGTTVKIDGSTSMVQINQALKNGFELQFPGTRVLTNAGGSNKGIRDLLTDRVILAAISRPLTAEEQNQGLVSVPIAKDAIAIVVGDKNAFRRGLTQEQVKGIFQGQITNWSALGRPSATIFVINRPVISGTRQTFQELVLQGENFGTTQNITTMERDATTPILQALGINGISYATYAQVAQQRTVRTVPIDGLTPEANNYPYQRSLYYVYKQPANPAVKAFLGYATSPKGQQAIANATQGLDMSR
jgi:phosphate transport system substrate-binding protein